MPENFYAVTKIKYGKRVEDGSQDGKYESKVFEVDEKVTGLSSEDMKDLWKAGALRKETAEDRERESKQEDKRSTSEDETSKTPVKAAPAKATPAKQQS